MVYINHHDHGIHELAEYFNKALRVLFSYVSFSLSEENDSKWVELGQNYGQSINSTIIQSVVATSS